LRIFNVEELPTHGGSLRIHGCHAEDGRPEQPAVGAILQAEQTTGLRDIASYQTFQSRADKVKNDLLEFLIEQKRVGNKVAAYGAAAKGNTLLNYAGVKPDLLSYVCDAAAAKQGKYLPGSHIPILPPTALAERQPNYVLILPWNIADEVKDQLGVIAARGTKFVTAIPTLTVC
jgi:hypothetical protein